MGERVCAYVYQREREGREIERVSVRERERAHIQTSEHAKEREKRKETTSAREKKRI